MIDTVNRHPFDTILMALNAADAHIHSFTDQILPLVVEKQMGIIGMKVPARGRLLSSWTPPPVVQQHMWEGAAIATRKGVMNMREAMNFVLSHPVSTVIMGCDNSAQLEENVQIAHDLTPLSQSQMAALNQLAAPVAKQSLFLRFTDRSRGLVRVVEVTHKAGCHPERSEGPQTFRLVSELQFFGFFHALPVRGTSLSPGPCSAVTIPRAQRTGFFLPPGRRSAQRRSPHDEP